MVLDKNPEKIITKNFDLIKKEFENNVPSLVVCSEPFYKAEFLIHLANSTDMPIIFVDLDFLYSGYVKSGMIEKKDNLTIIHPSKDSWSENLTSAISKASKGKFLIIIDSLNGVYNMFDDLDSVRFVNSSLMLLSSLGKQANSSVIITAMVRKKENKEWVLSPGGRQLVKSSQTSMFYVKKIENQLILSKLGINNSEKYLIAEKV